MAKSRNCDKILLKYLPLFLRYLIMLYSKDYNFCFVHISKNAGSSIRAALNPYISRTTTMYIGKISRLLNLHLPCGIIALLLMLQRANVNYILEINGKI